jgi:hypothetical protein
MKWLIYFFVGLAIGLWIAVVVLFLLPEREQNIQVTVSADGSKSSMRTLWVPGGDDVYRCSNNDHGGGLVEDHGRGTVDDHGRGTVDDHGRGTVDDHGGGVVEDGAAHVPAPTGGLLSDSRGYQDFWCDLNDYGGPVVKHRDGRVVAVAMPVGPEYKCIKDLNGDAVVVTEGDDNELIPVEIDHGGGVVDDHGRGTVEDSGVQTSPAAGEDGCTGITDSCSTGSDVLTGTNFVYCMVVFPDSDPIIVNIDGVEVPSN